MNLLNNWQWRILEGVFPFTKFLVVQQQQPDTVHVLLCLDTQFGNIENQMLTWLSERCLLHNTPALHTPHLN